MKMRLSHVEIANHVDTVLWRRWVTVVASTLIVFVVGCGGDGKLKVYPTEGSLSMDGEALGPATFLMVPEPQDEKKPKPTVSGIVDASGKISFSTYANGDGAPAGDYAVQFTPGLIGKPNKPIPQVYGDSKASKLKIKVLEATKSNPNVVKMDLDSKIKSGNSAMATGRGGPPINSKYPPIDPSLMPKTSP